MACCTATWAWFASFTTCAFSFFSVMRSFAASARSPSISDTASLSWLISSPNFAISAVSFSDSAVSLSTSAALFSRVSLLLASSEVQYPCCSASSLASSISLVIKSLIIFLTFSKGSVMVWAAINARYLLPSALERDCRKAAARCCNVRSFCTKLIAWANALAFLDWMSAADGKCFSALPATASLVRIEIASSIALISSDRVIWFCSYSFDLTWHSASVSDRAFSSSALLFVVEFRSPFAAAASSIRPAFDAVFAATVLESCSWLSVNCCMNS
mmetsp:Transcript_33145/g.64245  ORF Transcript_33145/g.64245 Transcript_33145/m.64245 type:complete len:273 (+) Transcript_33145:575-1393(+)